MSMHKYRSPDSDEEIRVVTKTGHVARVGREWKELPKIYHDAAIEAGCECDAKTVVKNGAKPEAGPNAPKDRTKAEKIELALKAMMEREEDGDFTDAGSPNLNVVAKLAGCKVKRAEVLPIFDRLVEQADKDDDDDDGEDD